MRNMFTLLLLTLLLTACLSALQPAAKQDKVSEGFSEAMRWSDFQGAAAYVNLRVRGAFMEQFPEDDDLHIVDSSISSVELGQDEERVDVVYVMEYYHLPSSKIKKWRWTQQWRLIKKNDSDSGAWLIDNEPPPLPWRE